MKINFDSELMANQSHAVVMAPDAAFEALQSQDGGSLFFSLGTDHVFYLTREAPATATGWTKLDLSSVLAQKFNGAAIAAKSFSVAQNPQTQGIDIGLVITVSGADYLFLSLGNANTTDSWANGAAWTAIPFDAGTAPTPLTISNVYLMNVLSQGAQVENIFVDILSSPGNTLEPIARYYISPGASPQWNAHYLPAEMSAGSVTSCLGNRPGDPVPGIYTMGSIGGDEQLIFTPQYNYFGANPPSPTKLTLPAGASAAASALNGAGVTNLFLSATGGLYVFAPGNQGEDAAPVIASANPLTAGASRLAASTSGGQTAVWGINAQGNLFYVQCPEGSEANPASWSNPVPLLPGAEEFAFYLNLNAGTNVLFANIDGQNLVQLTQDPATANWLQRSILLPGTSVDDMAVYNSFTTHIQITDDNGVAAPNTAASITATTAVSVYLNGVYHVLSPSVPLNVTADATGVLTIVQATDSLSAVCFQVTLTETPTVTQTINPMSNVQARLATVTNGTSLANVVVTNSDGTQQPLIPAGTSSSDLDSAAQSIVQFQQVASGLPQNGSRVTPSSTAAATAHFALRFQPTGLQYVEGPEASASLASGNPIAVAAEDFFMWVKHIVHEIESFTVKAVEGVYHFFATIGGEIYDVLLDCIGSVVHAVEYVFNKIKVFFTDLIKWLGFLFNWSDIVNTHKAVKNVLKQCVIRAVNQIATLETDVENAFQNLENNLNSWAGLPAAPNTMGGYQSSSSSAPGTGSPQSNWALHHTKGNVSQAATTYSNPAADRGVFATVIADLEKMVDNEIGDIKTAITQLKSDVIDQLATLTPLQVVEKVVAIVLDFILSTAENLIVTSLEIIAAVVEGIIDLLDAPLDIPILSPIYKEISGGDALSFLDLTCLVCAIPATIVYKLVTNQAPYSAADAQALQQATSFAALQTIFNGSSTQPAGTAMLRAADSSQPSQLMFVTTIIADVFALFGSMLTAVMAVAKKAESEATAPSKALRYIAACSYFPYVAPDMVGAFSSAGAWYTVMNDIVTIVAIVKTLTDNSDTLNEDTPLTAAENQMWRTYISPVAECVINGVWLAPAIGSIVADHSAADKWISFASNLAFDIGGIAAPASEEKIVGAEVAAVVFVAIQVLTVGYGLLSTGAGVAVAMESSPSSSAAVAG
ncbi:MAG: hypothetical protein JNK48_14130 [Bryobacterales bacterium]|nr:hypothetical protein [Bryobacterales bacterium]